MAQSTKTEGAIKAGDGRFIFDLAKLHTIDAGTGYSTAHGPVVDPCGRDELPGPFLPRLMKMLDIRAEDDRDSLACAEHVFRLVVPVDVRGNKIHRNLVVRAMLYECIRPCCLRRGRPANPQSGTHLF